MKNLLIILVLISGVSMAQVDLGEFNLSNNSSPAFLLAEESTTLIYTPENLKAFLICIEQEGYIYLPPP